MNPASGRDLALYQEIATGEGLRLFPIIGDSMEPTFRRGDFALVAPTDCWQGDGCYVLNGPDGPAMFRVGCAGRMAQIISDNVRYSTWERPRDQMVADILAKAVFSLNVMDRRLVPDRLRF